MTNSREKVSEEGQVEQTAEIPAPPVQEAPAASVSEPQPTPQPVKFAPLAGAASAAPRIKERQRDALAKRRLKRQLKLERIVELVKERKRITNDQIEKVLHVSDATASRYLAQLVKEGRLKRSGSPEHAYYELL